VLLRRGPVVALRRARDPRLAHATAHREHVCGTAGSRGMNREGGWRGRGAARRRRGGGRRLAAHRASRRARCRAACRGRR
jgi:hypothetical protein